MKRSRSPLAAAIAFCAALGVAIMSPDALAQNYTVTINPTLNGLDVKFAYQANQGMLIVTTTNNADKKVRCDFVFNAPPQFPDNTIRICATRQEGNERAQGNTMWFSVNVDVTCVAVSD